MRILHANGSDPVLTDTHAGLNSLHRRLQSFLNSESVELELEAEQAGDPSPYESFLAGLRIRKGSKAIVLSQASNGWLALEGSPENLRVYVSHFYFKPNQASGHHHPENHDLEGYISPASMRLIIEAEEMGGE
jgi:hypothetical protein